MRASVSIVLAFDSANSVYGNQKVGQYTNIKSLNLLSLTLR
jgi:hypothetical protein